MKRKAKKKAETAEQRSCRLFAEMMLRIFYDEPRPRELAEMQAQAAGAEASGASREDGTKVAVEPQEAETPERAGAD